MARHPIIIRWKEKYMLKINTFYKIIYSLVFVATVYAQESHRRISPRKFLDKRTKDLLSGKTYENFMSETAGEKKYEQARQIYQFALNNSDKLHPIQRANAQYNLAHLFCWGKGGNKEHLPAQQLYQQALDSKLLSASETVLVQYVLALIFYGGEHGAEKNCMRSSELFTAALASNELSLSDKTNAQFHLASLHYNGIKGEPDYPQARILYQNALVNSRITLYQSKLASINSRELPPLLKAIAQYRLATMLYHGWGTEKNYQRAQELCQSTLTIEQVPPEGRADIEKLLSDIQAAQQEENGLNMLLRAALTEESQ